MVLAVDEQLPHGLQMGRTELRCWSLPVRIVERTKGVAHGLHFAGGRAVIMAVILLEVPLVASDQLGEAQLGGRYIFGQAPATGFPIEDESLVLRLAGGAVVLAEQVVLAPSGDRIVERDDGLTRLAMQTIGRDAGLSGHGAFSLARKVPRYSGFFGRAVPTQTGTLKVRSAKGLR